jgi:hypothetical protein
MVLLDIKISLLATVSSNTAHNLTQLYTILKLLIRFFPELIILTVGFTIAVGQSTVQVRLT